MKSSKTGGNHGIANHTYRFGVFRLDPGRRVLERGGKPVELGSRAFDVLNALVANSGRVVSKDELLEMVWPESHVEEANLAQAVSILRKVLDDPPGEHRYIATVPSRGYSFVADVVRETPVSVPQRQKKRTVLSVIVVLATLAIAVVSVVRRPAETGIRLAILTSYPGRELFPRFSPDGQQVAFSWVRDGMMDVYVKLLETEQPLQLTTTGNNWFPVWSPDGRQIAFLRCCLPDAGFFVVPSLGGAERKVADAHTPRSNRLGRPVDWSPDGKHLLISDHAGPGEPLSLFLVAVDTGERRRLTFSPPGSTDNSGQFSPDGRSIAFVRKPTIEGGDIFVIPAAGGGPRRVTFDNRSTGGLTWTADGREIVFSSTRGSGGYAFWRIPVGGGTPTRIAGIGEGVYYPAIDRQGRRLAWSQATFNINLWRQAIGSRSISALMSSTQRELSPQYSPDGTRLAFVSTRTGPAEIWVSDADGNEPLQLTTFGGPPARNPRWSPDGKHIAFDSRQEGHADIFVIGSHGGKPRRLVHEPSEDEAASWSRDGRWIYFGSNRSSGWQIWKMSAAGGTAKQVTRGGGFAGLESADGKFLYYVRDRHTAGLWRVPSDGGEETRILDAPAQNDWNHFSVTTRGVYFVDRTGAIPRLQLLNEKNGSIITVADFMKPPDRENQGEPAPGFTVSPDGSWMIYPVSEAGGADIHVAENFH